MVATARRLSAIADLRESGAAALALEVDVASEASLKSAMEQAAALGGGALGAVICNAGISCFGPAAVQPLEEVQKVLDTNVLGVLRTVQAAVPFMAKPSGKGGRVLIVGSISATLTTPFAGAYCASKAAVQALGEALRMELKPLGISVTNIHAGAIRSNFSSCAEGNSDLDRYKEGPYASLLPAIKTRIWLSQTQPTTQSPEKVAQDILRKCFGQGPSPAAILVAGGAFKALVYGFVQKWLPAWLMDFAMAKTFGLAQLGAP